MNKYRTFRTTMGRKYRVRMTKEEVEEQELYNIVIVTLPFISAILLFVVWYTRG